MIFIEVSSFCYFTSNSVKKIGTITDSFIYGEENKEPDATNQRGPSVRNFIKTYMLMFCWSEAFKCVLKQCQRGETSTVTLEKQLLLSISLERLDPISEHL